MSEWIKCSDQLPNEGQLVLCLLSNKLIFLNGVPIYPQKVLMFNRLNPRMDLMFIDENYYSFTPSHWMPLPRPPK